MHSQYWSLSVLNFVCCFCVCVCVCHYTVGGWVLVYAFTILIPFSIKFCVCVCVCVITLWVVECWCMHSQYWSLSVLNFLCVCVCVSLQCGWLSVGVCIHNIYPFHYLCVCVCVCVCVCCQDFGVLNNVQHQKLIIVMKYSTVTVIIIIIINYNMGTNLWSVSRIWACVCPPTSKWHCHPHPQTCQGVWNRCHQSLPGWCRSHQALRCPEIWTVIFSVPWIVNWCCWTSSGTVPGQHICVCVVLDNFHSKTPFLLLVEF